MMKTKKANPHQVNTIITQSSFNDMEKWKIKAMRYQQDTKKAIEKAFVENGFRPLSQVGTGEWKVNETGHQYAIFDYLIPNGHIEVLVTLSGWEQSCINEEFNA